MSTPKEIIDKIIYLLDSKKANWEFSRYGNRNDFEENHVWIVGREILKSLDGFQVYVDFNPITNQLYGIDIKINYNDPFMLVLEKKKTPQVYVNFNPLPSSTVDGLIKAVNNFKKGFEGMFTSLRYIHILKVIFNDPATIVIWSDNTKTVVKAQEGEVFDKEKGLAMAICKKAMGNEGNYYSEFKKWLED